MADKKISEMTSMTAGQIASDDNIVIADTSANHTKRANISELATFFGVNTEGIQDTVGAMFTGHSSHSGITPVYDDPNGHLIFSLAGGVTTAEMGYLNGVTSDIQTQLNSKSPLASPTFTGNPTAPTQSANDNSTKISTTAFVQGELTGYASDSATFTNKSGDISQWTNDSGYITPSSTSTLTNKSGSISQWTNNSGYITATSTDTLSNKTINGSNNTITNVPYSALTSIVDTDITSVSGSDNEIASSKAIKTYVDAQISGIDTIAEAGDTAITSPSSGQILVHDGSNSFDNKTASVTLTGAVTGTANMSSTGAVSVATTIPTNTITINGTAVALGGSATIPSVLQSGGTFTGELHLNDNVKLSLGGASGSGDLQIYHDTSNSNIQNDTGELVFRSSTYKFQNQGNSETLIRADENDGVDLYFDNSKKAETLTDGFGVTGNITVSGTVDGRDLQTDGTKLDGISSGAEVNVQANWSESSNTSDAFIQNKPSLSTVATSGSYADLSNKPTVPTNNNQLTNGANYLATTGGTMTGNLAHGDNVKATFGASNDLEIYHDGTNSFIKDVGTGGLYLRGDSVIALGVGSESAVRCAINGDVKLYYDDAEKLATTSGGVTVTGDLTATDLLATLDSGQRFKTDGWYSTSDSKERFYFSNNSHTYIKSANSMFFRCNNGNTDHFTIDTSGNATATGNVTAYSDERLKSDVKTIDNALDKVTQMRGVTFTKDDTKGSGVIAQELEKIAPELVHTANDEMGSKSVAYGNTVGYLIEAIKELKSEVEELKTKKLCKCED